MLIIFEVTYSCLEILVQKLIFRKSPVSALVTVYFIQLREVSFNNHVIRFRTQLNSYVLQTIILNVAWRSEKMTLDTFNIFFTVSRIRVTKDCYRSLWILLRCLCIWNYHKKKNSFYGFKKNFNFFHVRLMELPLSKLFYPK